jgi:anion-transporting  ArsA/GET3 family ATPase
MKKFRFLFIIAIITLSFTVPVSAVESGIESTIEETITMGTEETVGETLTETETEGATEGETGVTVELPEDLDEEGLRAYWESFKENISKLSVWLIAFFSTSGVAIMGFIVKWGIKKIFERIADNAHKTDTKIDDKLLAHKDEIMAALDKMTDKINNEMANMDKMFEIMSVFIMNSNEPASSKAEMMEMMQGFKKYNGSIAEVVRQAQEDIDKHKAEKAAMQNPTPELDQLIEERKK